MMYSWHQEVFNRCLNKMAHHGKKIEINPEGWLNFFETTYPDVYLKYQQTEKEINEIWGQSDPSSMDRFKKLSKQLSEATIWALDKFVEDKQKKNEAAHLAGKQEGLGHWDL